MILPAFGVLGRIFSLPAALRGSYGDLSNARIPTYERGLGFGDYGLGFRFRV